MVCHTHAFLCLVSFLLVPLTLGSGDLGNYRCHFILLFLISLKFLFQFFAGLAQVIWAIIAAILSFLYVSCSPLISFSISTFLLLRFVGWHFLVLSRHEYLSLSFVLCFLFSFVQVSDIVLSSLFFKNYCQLNKKHWAWFILGCQFQDMLHTLCLFPEGKKGLAYW